MFEAILEKAITICDAKFGSLFRFDGKTLRPAAQVGAPSSLIEAQRRLGGPVRGSLLERVMKTKQVNSTADAAADPFPGLAAQFAGARSIVGVPMLKDDMLIGAISVYRQEVRPFDNKQISCSRTLPPKPLSPSRTRGCSTNYVSGSRPHRAYSRPDGGARAADGHF